MESKVLHTVWWCTDGVHWFWGSVLEEFNFPSHKKLLIEASHNFYLGHLFDFQMKAGPFEEYFIATILREILKGLDYLHVEKKLHRDIKGEASTQLVIVNKLIWLTDHTLITGLTLPTTYRPHTDHVPTTFTNHIPTTFTNHILTIYRHINLFTITNPRELLQLGFQTWSVLRLRASMTSLRSCQFFIVLLMLPLSSPV